MQLSYDPRYNVAYLKFQEKSELVESVRVSESLVVDLHPDGTIYGIELLNANEQLHVEGTAGRLVVLNESTGKTAEVRLP